MLGEQLAEHRDENIDRIGWRALRVAQQSTVRGPYRRMVRAVHLRGAVDQIEHKFLLYHRDDVASPERLRSLPSWRPLRLRVRRIEFVPTVRIRGRRLSRARRHGDGVRQQLDRGAERAA